MISSFGTITNSICQSIPPPDVLFPQRWICNQVSHQSLLHANKILPHDNFSFRLKLIIISKKNQPVNVGQKGSTLFINFTRLCPLTSGDPVIHAYLNPFPKVKQPLKISLKRKKNTAVVPYNFHKNSLALEMSLGWPRKKKTVISGQSQSWTQDRLQITSLSPDNITITVKRKIRC